MCTSWKVWLKEMRWPSFSVSTRTPSQSNRRAEGRVEEEDAEAEQLNLRGGTLTLVVEETPKVVVGLEILREERVVKEDGGRWSLCFVCLRRQWVFGWGVVGVKSEEEEKEMMLLEAAIDHTLHRPSTPFFPSIHHWIHFQLIICFFGSNFQRPTQVSIRFSLLNTRHVEQ